MAYREDINEKQQLENASSGKGLENKLKELTGSSTLTKDSPIKDFNESMGLSSESNRIPKEFKRYSGEIAAILNEYKDNLGRKEAALRILANIMGIPEGPFADDFSNSTSMSETINNTMPMNQDSLNTTPDVGTGDEPDTISESQHIKVSQAQLTKLLVKIAELVLQNLELKKDR